MAKQPAHGVVVPPPEGAVGRTFKGEAANHDGAVLGRDDGGRGGFHWSRTSDGNEAMKCCAAFGAIGFGGRSWCSHQEGCSRVVRNPPPSPRGALTLLAFRALNSLEAFYFCGSFALSREPAGGGVPLVNTSMKTKVMKCCATC